MKFLGLVLKSVRRSKRRTALTTLSVAIAVFLFASLQAVLDGFDAVAAASSSTRVVTIRSTSMIFPMPSSHVETIRSTPGVQEATWANWFGGIYKDPKNFFGQFAIDPYEYPPTFLLAPRALAAVAPEFVAFRHVWLILNAILVVAGGTGAADLRLRDDLDGGGDVQQPLWVLGHRGDLDAHQLLDVELLQIGEGGAGRREQRPAMQRPYTQRGVRQARCAVSLERQVSGHGQHPPATARSRDAPGPTSSPAPARRPWARPRSPRCGPRHQASRRPPQSTRTRARP